LPAAVARPVAKKEALGIAAMTAHQSLELLTLFRRQDLSLPRPACYRA